MGLEGRGSWSSALRLVPPLKFPPVVPFVGGCEEEFEMVETSFLEVEDEAGGAGGRERGVWEGLVDPRDERTESRNWAKG